MSTPIGGANGTDRVWQRAEPRERGKPSKGPNLTDVAVALAKSQPPHSAENLTDRTINKKENDELEGVLTEAFQALAKVESSPVASAPAAPQPPLDQTIPKVDNVFKRAMTSLKNVLATIGKGIAKTASKIKFKWDTGSFRQDTFTPIFLEESLIHAPISLKNLFPNTSDLNALKKLGKAIGGTDKLLLAIRATPKESLGPLLRTFIKASSEIRGGKVPSSDTYQGKVKYPNSDEVKTLPYSFTGGKFYVALEKFSGGGMKSIAYAINVTDGTESVRERAVGRAAGRINAQQDMLEKINKTKSPYIIPVRHIGLKTQTKVSQKTGKAEDKFVSFKPRVDGDATKLKKKDRAIFDCLVKTALGLRDLHKENIVHGDLKPQNILVLTDRETKELKVYLHDFDMAKIAGEKNKSQGTVITWPPEFFKNNKTLNPDTPTSTKADMYSLGATLLMFYPDFEKALDSHVYNQYEALDQRLLTTEQMTTFFSELRNKVNDPKKQFLLEALDLAEKLMDPDPAKRPDAKEAAKALIKIHDKIPKDT